MAIAATVTCTLYVLASTQVYEMKNLSLKDASDKYWEYANHAEYDNIAMEAIYCNSRLTLILNQTNTDAVSGAKQMAPGEVPEIPK